MSEFKVKANDNGDCEVILPAGQDFVRTIKAEGEAKALLATAKTVEPSELFEGFVSLNGGAIFIAVEPEKADKPSKAEKPADEEKAEPKKTAGKGKAKAKSE